MVDFTNPAARTWYKTMIKNNLLGTARSIGWMADFAEQNPMDVKAKNWIGWSGSYHNKYPEDWAQLN